MLEREGLSEKIKVIGGGRISDGFVTASVKSALVTRLQDVHKKYVWAFGDNSLDLEMLSKSNQAIVVVGEEHTRSKTMDIALDYAIFDGWVNARQILLPRHATPRLDTAQLPLVQFTDKDFIDSVFRRHSPRHSDIKIHQAADKKVAKMHMTPTRNSEFAGPEKLIGV